MNAVDHLFIFLLLIVQPIYGAWSYRRFVARIRAGQPADRLQAYRETMIIEWVALAVLLIAWIIFGRTAGELGFVQPGGAGFWVGAALLVLLCALLPHFRRRIESMSPEDRAKEVAAFGDTVHFLPHTQREYRGIIYVSLTAGIVEEIIYRGFLFWYLSAFMPMWAVVVVSSVMFGLGHSYQGVGGVAKVTLLGLVFGAFYLLTGSIWLPIIGHALVDILQVALIFQVLKERPAPRRAVATG